MKRTRTDGPGARRWLVAAALATSAQLPAAPLSAQPTESAETRARARSHFDRGVGLAKARDYRAALSEFQLAHEISPHFSVLYNIAQALTLLGRHSEAGATLQRYLKQGGAQIDARRRAEAEAAIARERELTSTIELTVDADGALISLDDQPAGRSPLPAPLRVDPGPHRLRAQLDSGEQRETTLEIAAKQAISVHLELRAPSPALPAAAPPPASALLAAPAPAAPPPAPHLKPTPRPAAVQKTLGYVIGAAGVAVSGAALVHYLWNRNRYEDWQARQATYYRDPSEQHRASANDLAESIPAASLVTIGLAIGAGVALGTGTLLVLTSGSSTPASGAQARGTFMSLRGEF